MCTWRFIDSIRDAIVLLCGIKSQTFVDIISNLYFCNTFVGIRYKIIVTFIITNKPFFLTVVFFLLIFCCIRFRWFYVFVEWYYFWIRFWNWWVNCFCICRFVVDVIDVFEWAHYVGIIIVSVILFWISGMLMVVVFCTCFCCVAMLLVFLVKEKTVEFCEISGLVLFWINVVFETFFCV